MDKLQWFVAPIKTEWGEDMMCAGVKIDNDHMFDIYCERSQIEKVEQMLRQLKPEQEPVAWRWENNGSDNWIRKYTYLDNGAPDEPELCEALYTAPPSKPWVSLTDEQIRNFYWPYKPTLIEYVRFIEAKSKELNHG